MTEVQDGNSETTANDFGTVLKINHKDCEGVSAVGNVYETRLPSLSYNHNSAAGFNSD